MKKIPYARQWIDKDDIKAVNNLLKSDYLTQGPKVEAFEKSIASYCGAKYAVAVNSGTAALHLACLAAGLKKNDEVITSSITFVASANCALYCGARPVFLDVNEATICIDPEQIEKKITSRTKIIIPVHFAGHPADLIKLKKIARKNNLIVIEDAAHALGAKYRGGRIGSGKYSDMTILSFHAVKHIVTGEGGMVLTNNKKLYDKLVMLRTHGKTRSPKSLNKNCGDWYYQMHYLGFNYRLTDIQSFLGLSKLKKLPDFIRRRKKIVAAYNKVFEGCDGLRPLIEKEDVNSSHHLYILRFDQKKFSISRKEIFDQYRKKGILVNVHYIPVYFQPYYKALGYKTGLCPTAENYYHQAITLPLYPKMSDLDVKRVIKITRHIIEKYKK